MIFAGKKYIGVYIDSKMGWKVGSHKALLAQFKRGKENETLPAA